MFLNYKMSFFGFVLIFLCFKTLECIDTEFDYQNIVISLGGCCKTADYIRQYKFNTWAYPFDWALTSFDSVYRTIKNDFKDFLKKENLIDLRFWNRKLKISQSHIDWGAQWVYDKKYDFESVHDFKSGISIDEQLAGVQAKYARRIDRFYRALNSGKPVYLVRRGIKRIQAIALRNLLDKKFPFANYTIIAFDDSDEIKRDWHLPRIKNYYLDDILYKYNSATQKYEYNFIRRNEEFAAVFIKLGIVLEKDLHFTPQFIDALNEH